MGSIATFLAKLPEDDDRRNTPLKSVLLVPLSTETLSFIRRIGVDWYTTFNMSEVAVPLVTERKPTKIGVCGRRRLGAELRIVDEQDNEVPDGTVGQLVLRDAEPWALCSGYYKDYEATAKAWRNGWFHTGDAFRRDAEGDYFYIDRMKDAIRRRGENISSFEVEAVVNEHPDVHESAAIAVPSEHGEDEVMIVVMTVPGRLVNPPDLIEYLIPRMPHYMIPRYIELTDSLPRTPTMKVQKAKLRETGISENTFDREAAGIKLHRHQFCRVGG
jgi:crotonobetaine/carnitine-CoA ligase